MCVTPGRYDLETIIVVTIQKSVLTCVNVVACLSVCLCWCVFSYSERYDSCSYGVAMPLISFPERVRLPPVRNYNDFSFATHFQWRDEEKAVSPGRADCTAQRWKRRLQQPSGYVKPATH